MTGDGINDILALKKANLGIAMQSGSQATRNVADIVLLEDSFGALPEAFQEGQRILNGMQDILRLYMSRIFVLAILIAAIGFASDGFPITPRQNAVITFFTLSIPTLCLALWARPSQIPRVRLSRALPHFVIPAVITIASVGFAVYLFTLIKTGDQSYAQTTLTYMIIICGILLIIFVEPPTKWWTGGDVLSGDWRPTLLAIGLLLLFLVFLVAPVLREFYGLALLRQPSHYVFIALATIIWVFILRFVWRARLVDRYLNMDLNPD
jgi:cation-transporting ATPase E